MLEEIADRIAEDNPSMAARTTRRLYDLGENLATFPDRARPGRYYPQTRDLVARPYLLIFRVHAHEVEILAVVDGRRGNIAEVVTDRLDDA